MADKNLNEEKIEQIIGEMTLEEKIEQMQQLAATATPAEILEELSHKGNIGAYLNVSDEQKAEYIEYSKNSRFKIPPVFGVDAIHGHALLKGATVFPSQLAMACSWNESLIEEVARVTAREAAADGFDWVFSPVLCLGRDLRWGRINETFGEDSLLVSRLGAAMVKGYQADGNVMACAKHYIGYGEATGGRDSYNSVITERSAREIFLKPFVAAINAGCLTVMTSYGSIDGEALTASKFWLTDILKEELGFSGFVVTDWNNVNTLVSGQAVAENIVEASALATNAGNDMCMRSYEFVAAAKEAVKNGTLPIERVNDAVRRILRAKAKIGAFDSEKNRPPRSVIGCAEHRQINERVALESVVLLKNDGILPVKNAKKIAVIGPNADDVRAQYGDWTYFTHPEPHPEAEPKNDVYTVLKGIREVYSDCDVIYAKGCSLGGAEVCEEEQIEQAVRAAKEAEVVIAAMGDTVQWNGETKDVAQPILRGRQEELLRRVYEVNKNVVLVLVNGKPLVLSGVLPYCNAVIEAFNGGDLSGLAIAKLICGQKNFSGKLPISFSSAVGAEPCYYNRYEYWHGGSYCDVSAKSPFPFGFGLSYSRFEYGNLVLSKKVAKFGDTITLFCDVRNVSDVDGFEIVQLYFKDKICKILTPVRTLLDYRKVFISAGKTVRVEFSVAVKDLGFYDMDCSYRVDLGEFLFFVSGNGVEFKEGLLVVE